METSSRIFIRGLPPGLNSNEFQQHFSTIFTITDARLIPHRRIGYVGFKTPEDAAKAVKHYNKSFIRMSKLYVELAHSVDQQRALKDQANLENQRAGKVSDRKDITEVEAGQKTKRKRDNGHDKAKDSKLQEYLEAMQPPSKSQIWANEDISRDTNPTIQMETFEGAQGDEIDQNDGTYQDIPQKQKKQRKVERSPSPPHKVESNVVTNTKEVEVQPIPEVPSGHEGVELPAASDEDWLRSRTNRLLGLVDDEDAFTARGLPNIGGKEQEQRASSSKDPEGGRTPDTSVQAELTAGDPHSIKSRIETDADNNDVADSGRLFIRNLSYAMTDDDLRKHFEDQGYGLVEEVHMPIDHRSGHNKGFAYVLFVEPEVAKRAIEDLDGKPLQGRLLHIMPSAPKKHTKLDDYAISKLPLKKQQQIRKRAEAASSTFNWNSMYMNADAVMASISDRLGVLKSDLMDPTSADAALKQAHAETHIINECKAYFTANGIDLDAFKNRERGEIAILVKNFSYGTKAEELKELFQVYGNVKRLLMPPSGTIAIVEFEQADCARSAFRNLAYRRFKESVLFLEKAPKNLLNGNITAKFDKVSADAKKQEPKQSTLALLEANEVEHNAPTSTLFVRNLNFSTTSDGLRDLFKPLDGFLSARVKTKTDPKRPGQVLSMGFGFVEFRTKKQADTALAAMDGHSLDGHELLVRTSHRAIDAAEERRKDDLNKKLAGRRTKIIIKNLPFEASKKDVRSLLSSYGQLRSVRLPKKFNSSTRGFAFADFVTAREAENAMDALRDTHLLGRRLVLDFAAEDATDPEQEIEKMQEKVGKQANKVKLQGLTAPGRKKFIVEGIEDVDRD